MHHDFYTLRYRLPERNVPPLVYCNYNEERANAHNQFLKSQSDFKNLETFKLPTFSPVRKPIPESSYAGITVCGLPLEEVGCGILTIAQGLADRSEIVDRELIEELTSVIEEKGYYFTGKGLYWHTFKYFAGHLSCHWYEIVLAIECGNPVTLLLKYPENSRNLFTNIIATKNILAINKGEHTVPLTDPADYHFVISDGREISLKELMNPDFLVTAPWIWPTKI